MREGSDREGQEEKPRPGDAGRSRVISVIMTLGERTLCQALPKCCVQMLTLGALLLVLFIVFICFYTNSFKL